MNTNFSLSFHNVDFDITDIHGQPWLRSFQIGSALGYKNPSSDMAKLYDRNADEFTDSMTQVIELPTAGGKQQRGNDGDEELGEGHFRQPLRNGNGVGL